MKLTLFIQTILQSGTTFIFSDVAEQAERVVPLKVAPSINKSVSVRLFPYVADDFHTERRTN